jgi:hypothetical protein
MKKIYLRCKNEKCGHYRWAPKPSMWRNRANRGDRLLKCPRCTMPFIVPRKTIEKILKNNG